MGGELGRCSASCNPRDVPTAESDLALDAGGAATGMEADQSRVVALDQLGGGTGQCAEQTAAQACAVRGGGLSVATAAEARAVSSKGRGSPGWPPNKGTSVAGRAEAGRDRKSVV